MAALRGGFECDGSYRSGEDSKRPKYRFTGLNGIAIGANGDVAGNNTRGQVFDCN